LSLIHSVLSTVPKTKKAAVHPGLGQVNQRRRLLGHPSLGAVRTCRWTTRLALEVFQTSCQTGFRGRKPSFLNGSGQPEIRPGFPNQRLTEGKAQVLGMTAK
jgi:hypothetical protein